MLSRHTIEAYLHFLLRHRLLVSAHSGVDQAEDEMPVAVVGGDLSHLAAVTDRVLNPPVVEQDLGEA